MDLTIQKPQLTKPRFFGNQWTKRTFLTYDGSEHSIRLCLIILFTGWVEKRRNGWRLCFNRCVDFTVPWFEATFHFTLHRNSHKNKHGWFSFGPGREFVNQARAAGWNFSTHHWHVPETVLTQYPLLVLRYWIGLQANYFLFTQRRQNPYRHALQIKHLSVNPIGLQQIKHLLTQFGIVASVKQQTGKYHIEFLQSATRGMKTFYSLSIYQIANVEKLFDIAGWDRPEYRAPRLKAIQRYIRQYIGADIHR